MRYTLLYQTHMESATERTTQTVYDEIVEQICLADDLGIDGVWFAEHHFGALRGRVPAPLLLIMRAGALTKRIRLGPAVLLLPLHHPVALAEQVAMTDLLIGGRLDVGIGSGGDPLEMAAFGVLPDNRRYRFEEGTDVLVRLLRGEQIPFECLEPFGTRKVDPALAGLTARIQSNAYPPAALPEGITLEPLPQQKVEDMLWLAAMTDASSEVAGRLGAHLLLARGESDDKLNSHIEAYQRARRAAGHSSGQDAQATGHSSGQAIQASGYSQVTRGIYVAETDERAWTEAAPGIERYFRRSKKVADSDAVPALEEMAERGCFIVGSPRTVAREIAALHDRVPITHLAGDVRLPLLPHKLIMQSIRLLATEVIPKVDTVK